MSRASRVFTVPSVGYRAMMISKSAFISKFGDGDENFPAGANRAGDRAGDLGLAGDAVAVGHVHLPDAHAAFDGFDLHFDVPTPRRVAHLQTIQSLPADHAQRPEVPVVIPPQPADQETREPVAEALLRREIFLRQPESPGGYDKIRIEWQQVQQQLRIITAVGVEDGDGVDLVTQMREPGEAGLAVTAPRLEDDLRPAMFRNCGGAVGAAVVHHDDLLREALRDPLQHGADATDFV